MRSFFKYPELVNQTSTVIKKKTGLGPGGELLGQGGELAGTGW